VALHVNSEREWESSCLHRVEDSEVAAVGAYASNHRSFPTLIYVSGWFNPCTENTALGVRHAGGDALCEGSFLHWQDAYLTVLTSV
jgi:hypothetical protein